MTPPADLATEPRLLDAVELLADAVSQLARDCDGQGREVAIVYASAALDLCRSVRSEVGSG